MRGIEWAGLPTGQTIEGFLQGGTEYEECQNRGLVGTHASRLFPTVGRLLWGAC
jgi:hypothetical protein